MGSTAIAAAGAGATLVLAAVALLWMRARHERSLEDALYALDGHARALSAVVEWAVRRAEDAQANGVPALALELELETLVRRAVEEAATRAGAPIAALRVAGADDEPLVAAYGRDDAASLLDRIPVPPDAQPFRALTVAWTQGHGPNAGNGDGYRTALVVPIVEETRRTGVLVACAREPDAFGAEQVDGLERLAHELALGLASARRVAREQRRVRPS